VGPGLEGLSLVVPHFPCSNLNHDLFVVGMLVIDVGPEFQVGLRDAEDDKNVQKGVGSDPPRVDKSVGDFGVESEEEKKSKDLEEEASEGTGRPVKVEGRVELVEAEPAELELALGALHELAAARAFDQDVALGTWFCEEHLVQRVEHRQVPEREALHALNHLRQHTLPPCQLPLLTTHSALHFLRTRRVSHESHAPAARIRAPKHVR